MNENINEKDESLDERLNKSNVISCKGIFDLKVSHEKIYNIKAHLRKSESQIRIIRDEDNPALLDSRTMFSKKLSIDAKGLYALLMTIEVPEEKGYIQFKDILQALPDNLQKIRRLLNELKNARLAHFEEYHQGNTEGNYLRIYDWEIFFCPEINTHPERVYKKLEENNFNSLVLQSKTEIQTIETIEKAMRHQERGAVQRYNITREQNRKLK